MRLNRKGSLGFPEAIMAAMIVTLSLTMYMGILVLNTAEIDNEPDVNIDHRIFEGLTLADGEITGDIENKLIYAMERHGYKGVSVTCEVPGELGFEPLHIKIGKMDGKIGGERFPFLLKCADGRTVPAVIEVAVCV
ncbi:MAG: hypothetical protein FWC44_00715 [Methanomassiliicoccaceae archaeon]|nr:hypothetical protein [Methanomassiliicoccaceae archaeon]